MNEEANTTSGTDNLSGQSAPETAPSTEQAPEAQSAQTAPQQQPGVEGVPRRGALLLILLRYPRRCRSRNPLRCP